MGTLRALLSTHDKTGVVEFATALADRGVELVSTGGTARRLADAGMSVRSVQSLTGQPEMLGGRVKTLHPIIFAGILARREDREQMRELAEAEVGAIDIVVVNLYPFESTIAAPDHSLLEALEQIDIGGVSLLRAAAKNFTGVVPVVDPADYDRVIAAFDAGGPDLATRLSFAQKAVGHTAAYEAAICNYLGTVDPRADLALDEPPPRRAWPPRLAFTGDKRQTLRYGENPHQGAAVYATTTPGPSGVVAADQLQGKELSYNNFLDADAAWRLAQALPVPAAAIIKHANPCGVATGETISAAYLAARETDPVSAFGGIVAVNVDVDEATARSIAETFVEVVVAPGFSDDARRALEAKSNLRLVRLGTPAAGGEAGAAAFGEKADLEFRSIGGGLLVQQRDPGGAVEWVVVSTRAPDEKEEADLRFLWEVAAAVRSNAIVIGRAGRLLGVGAGQMSRVDSCRLAVWKAGEAGHDLAGSAAASDAFFPFADGIEALAQAGVRAVVQPGGSKRDPEVIEAADRHGVALVHTGTRHFRH